MYGQLRTRPHGSVPPPGNSRKGPGPGRLGGGHSLPGSPPRRPGRPSSVRHPLSAVGEDRGGPGSDRGHGEDRGPGADPFRQRVREAEGGGVGEAEGDGEAGAAAPGPLARAPGRRRRRGRGRRAPAGRCTWRSRSRRPGRWRRRVRWVARTSRSSSQAGLAVAVEPKPFQVRGAGLSKTYEDLMLLSPLPSSGMTRSSAPVTRRRRRVSLLGVLGILADPRQARPVADPRLPGSRASPSSSSPRCSQLGDLRIAWVQVEESLAALAGMLIIGLGDQHVTIDQPALAGRARRRGDGARRARPLDRAHRGAGGAGRADRPLRRHRASNTPPSAPPCSACS